MIDYENDIYTQVLNLVTVSYPTIEFSSLEDHIPAKFPCVCFYEAENRTDTQTIDSACNENDCIVLYEARIYSNKQEGKKAEVKAIRKIIDDYLIAKGFTRTSSVPLTSSNATKYQEITRYEAIINKNGTITRR